MNTQHVYNLDLDEIAENDGSVKVMPNPSDVLSSLAKQFSSFTPTIDVFLDNHIWSENIRKSLASHISEVARRAIGPNELLAKALREAMEPTLGLRQQLLKSFESYSSGPIIPFNDPALDITELEYDEPYEDVASFIEIDPDYARKIHDSNIGKALMKLPKNTKWQDLEFLIISDRALILYCRGKKLGQFDCEDLGMARMSTTDKDPDKKFIFLYNMALIQQNAHSGIWPTANVLAMPAGGVGIPTEKQLNRMYQTKRLLSKQLGKTFGMDDEPFDYDLERGYQPKFTLKFISELEVGLDEELPDPDKEEMPESLKYYQPPLE